MVFFLFFSLRTQLLLRTDAIPNRPYFIYKRLNVKGKSPFLSRYKLQKSCNNEKVHAIKIPMRKNEVAEDDVDESEYYSADMKPGQLREVKEEIMKREGIKNEREIQVRSILGKSGSKKGLN